MSERALLSKPVLMRRLALVPAVASASLAANRQGAFDTPFEHSSGLEALPIGGLTGTIPSPTLGQPQADIQACAVPPGLDRHRYRRPGWKWIATDCLQMSRRFYSCQPADARPTAPGAQRRMKHDDGAARTTGWPTR